MHAVLKKKTLEFCPLKQLKLSIHWAVSPSFLPLLASQPWEPQPGLPFLRSDYFTVRAEPDLIGLFCSWLLSLRTSSRLTHVSYDGITFYYTAVSCLSAHTYTTHTSSLSAFLSIDI